jgi:CRP/FNR family transcriptional activator FtrB
MRERDREAAAALPLFSGLDQATVARLFAVAKAGRVAAGTMLFREGEPAEHVHLLLSGIVEISRMEGKRECGVMMFTSGDAFMPGAALFEERYLISGRALSAVRLIRLAGAQLREEAERDPALAMRICQLVSGHWRMAVQHILDLKCRSAPQRLAAFLLRLVDEGPFPDTAELPIAKRHLAARVGMTAETLSRTFQLLAENGLHVRGSRILVNDRERIETFCGPAPYPYPAETSIGVNAL